VENQSDQVVQEYTKLDLRRGVDHIGVCVVFFCHDGDGNILLHRRSDKCRDEVGNWDCGGGSMEFGESFEEAVRREVKEEYCVDVCDLKQIKVNNVLRENNGIPTHWIAVLFAAKVDKNLVQKGEPEKMDDLGWFPIENLPNPRHSMLDQHLGMVLESGVIKS